MSYFHPERMPVLPARRRKAARLQLEELVSRTAETPKRRPPVVVAAAVAIVLLSIGAAAFAVAAHKPVTNKHLARCFTSASISGYATMLAVPAKPGSLGQIKNARDQCADLYQRRLPEARRAARDSTAAQARAPCPALGRLHMERRNRGGLPRPAGNLREIGPPSGSKAVETAQPPCGQAWRPRFPEPDRGRHAEYLVQPCAGRADPGLT